MLALHLPQASSMARWVLHMSENISPHIVLFFIVSHGVGTRRAPEQVGARSRASEEDVGVV